MRRQSKRDDCVIAAGGGGGGGALLMQIIIDRDKFRSTANNDDIVGPWSHRRFQQDSDVAVAMSLTNNANARYKIVSQYRYVVLC